MNQKEARKIIESLSKLHLSEWEKQSRDYDGVSWPSYICHEKVKSFLEGMQAEEVKALVEASQKIIDSIKFSGDINEVNLAPKISILREALSKFREAGK